jgi:hypothetical protein
MLTSKIMSSDPRISTDRNCMHMLRKIMDQIPAELMARVRRLEALALPQTAQETWEYEKWMNTARANGSSYVEALEYVIGMKLGGAH